MKRFSLVLALAAGMLSAQKFPATVATDSDLYRAVNRAETTLSAGIDASTLTLPVVSTSGFVPNTIVTVENERLKVCSVGGSSLTVCARAFGGTIAATHASGRAVRAQITAEYFNALADEVKAIEQTLGASLTNVSPWNSDLFNFTAQQPGGSLLAGANIITLSPVPRGVNGSDTNHYLYVSGGTGTAESCLITGGAATAGSSSGQIIITCANTHSGAWSIASATAGIQEALITIPSAAQAPPYGGGRVLVPAGYRLIHATITIPRGYTSVYGAGRVATTLHTDYTGGPVFSIPAYDQDAVGDMDIEGPNSGSSFAFSVLGSHFLCERVSIAGLGQGFSVTGSAWGLIARDIIITGLTGAGAYIDSNVEGGTWEHVLMAGTTSGSKGWHVRNSVGLSLRSVYTNAIGTAVWLDPLNSSLAIGVITLSDAYFDGYAAWSTYGLRISPDAGETVNTVMWRGGGAAGFQQYGLLLDGAGTFEDAIFEGLLFTGNAVSGVFVNQGRNLTFRDCYVQSNGTGGSAGMTILAGSAINVLGGLYGAGSLAGGSNTQTYGIYVQTATDVRIADVIAQPNITGPLIDAGGNTRLVIKNVLGYNPVGMKSITVGASPFSYTSGSSPETVYVTGGTVSSIKRGSTTIAPSSPAQISLAPNTAIVVTYTGTPTMVADVQ